MKIPSKKEVFWSISTDNNFVEKTLLAMFRRHQANKGIPNGKGFNRQTKIDGCRLGRWLAKVGRFTDGEGTRGTKNREQHLQAARDVLFHHVDQIITMMTEEARAASAAPAPIPAPAAITAEEQTALNLQRSAEILAMLEQRAAHVGIVPDERPTERNVTPEVWRGTGPGRMARTG